MKKITCNISSLIAGWLLLLIAGLTGCSESLVEEKGYPAEGVPLTLTLDAGMETRVSELGSVFDIASGSVGLYIYYKEDYDRDDLTKPYVRNLKCTIGTDRKIKPVGGNEDIYIYDNMTIVAFFPYNEEMSEGANWFETTADEEKYLITRDDYDQPYIPYRGIVDGVNPTNAYMAQIWLYPQHTAKIEILLVSKNNASFPDGASVKIAPLVDPVGADLAEDCGRQEWCDKITAYTHDGSGSNVRRYVTYLWKSSSDARKNNRISGGDILFESDKLTLIASDDIVLSAGTVFRYGYNMDTGEIFLPTSSNLVYDAGTLQGLSCNSNNAYQVCDIDLSGYASFTPLVMLDGMFDGGGHRITGLNVSGDREEAGLFGRIYGTSYLKNVNLIRPTITILSTQEATYVGALCGRVNGDMTEQLLLTLNNSLPAELPAVVKQALLAEMSAGVMNSTSSIMACRVEEPVIKVTTTGGKIYAGSLCGLNGVQAEAASFYGNIWDCYTLGGSLVVNENNPEYNEVALPGGFCGLNSGLIGRSYTTIDNITCQVKIQFGTDPVEILIDKYDGFCWNAEPGENSEYTGAVEIDDCYSAKSSLQEPAVLPFSANWPAAANWVNAAITKWPVMVRGWNSYSHKYWYQTGSSPSTYPILQWERR